MSPYPFPLLRAGLLAMTGSIIGSACLAEKPGEETSIIIIDDAPDGSAPSFEADASTPSLPVPPDSDVGFTPETDVDAGPDAGPETPTPTMPTLAEGIHLTGIEAYQSIASVLVADGVSVETEVPLVAGRTTLFRLQVATEADWTPAPVTALVELREGPDDAPRFLTTTTTIAGSTSAGDRSSALEIRVPAELLTGQTTAVFRLLGVSETRADTALPHQARWPRDGTPMALEANDRTGTLHLVLVPMRFDTDDSGRLPDTSPAQLEIIEGLLKALYPANGLRLEVREPIVWSSSVRWGDFNVELRALKQSDGPEFDHAYYYGMIRPSETFEEYCSGTCTTGQSFTVSSADATSYRVGSGVGFSGERWAWTLIHELGHMLGRGHATCGVSWWSQDGHYPHSEGVIGVAAWDARTDRLLTSTEVTDFMGYCSPLWVSDYTYLGLMRRMEESDALERVMSSALPARYRYIHWSDTYEPTWGRESFELDPTTGQWATVTFFDADGAVKDVVEVPLIPFAHDGEAAVLVPEGPADAVRIHVEAATTDFTLPYESPWPRQ